MIVFLGKLLFLFWQIVLSLRASREYRKAILSLQQLRLDDKKREVYRPITPGLMLIFEAGQVMRKNTLCYFAIGDRLSILFVAPIALRETDVLWVDSRNAKLEVVEREGIVIWRAAWVN